MRFILVFILIMLISFVACMYFPWWSTAVVSFLVSVLIRQKPWKSFVCGFLSVFVLWVGLSFWISWNNDHILAHKLSLLILKTGHSLAIILLTGITGGLVSGMAALTGGLFGRRATAQ